MHPKYCQFLQYCYIERWRLDLFLVQQITEKLVYVILHIKFDDKVPVLILQNFLLTTVELQVYARSRTATLTSRSS